MVPFLRRALVEAHPRAVAEDVRTMSAGLWSALAGPRIWAAAAGLLGVFALAIAACGLFGVIGHSIQQRRREFGVRMALGTQPNHVVKLVLGQAGAVVAAGAAIGLAASAGATRVLESVLFGVGSMDAATVVAVTAVVSRRRAGGSLAGRGAGGADPANGRPSGSSRRLVPTRFVAKHPRAGVGRWVAVFLGWGMRRNHFVQLDQYVERCPHGLLLKHAWPRLCCEDTSNGALLALMDVPAANALATGGNGGCCVPAWAVSAYESRSALRGFRATFVNRRAFCKEG